MIKDAFVVEGGTVYKRYEVCIPRRRKYAFQLSIEKWKFVVDNIVEHPFLYDGGYVSCPLCALYHGKRGPCDNKCPIAGDGFDHCYGGLYSNYMENKNLENAQAHLDYLLELYKRIYGEEYT